MSGDLLVIVPEGQDIVQIFQDGGCDPLIDRLAAELKSYTIDVTTEAGRKQIASIARKIASTKVALDEAGKSLIAEKQAQVALVNKERARIKERMQKMQDDFRKPLTEFENEQKRIIAELEQKKRDEAAAREDQLRQETEKQFAEAMEKTEREKHKQDVLANVDAHINKGIPVEPDEPKVFNSAQTFNSAPVQDAARVNATMQINYYLQRLKTEDIIYLTEKIKAKWFLND